jgi:hypothetical protein
MTRSRALRIERRRVVLSAMIAAVLPLIAAACGGGGDARPAAGEANSPAARLTLAVDGRSNENVSLTSLGLDVVAAWSASTSDSTDIYTSLSVDGGMSFSAPRRVNSTPGEARAGGEQPPRVVLVPQAGHTPDIVVVWTARGASGTKLLMSRSPYGVNDFVTSTVVPGGEAKGNRGWHSLATDSAGKAFVLWLDHRNSASSAPAAVHRHGEASNPTRTPEVAVEKANLSQLWFGSLDGTVTAKSVTGGVCYCCKTSLVTSGSNVYAAWRHVFPGNQRDIAFTMSRDGGKTFSEIRRVSEDKWQFDGCPENGPALAVGADGSINVAWVTPEGGKEGGPLTLYHATSADGITFSPRRQVRTAGAAGHVQMATPHSGGTVLTWDEVTSQGRRVMLARQQPGGEFDAPTMLDEGEGLYPALATTTKGTVVAWVKRGGPKTVISVRTLP